MLFTFRRFKEIFICIFLIIIIQRTLKTGEMRHMSMTLDPRNWPMHPWKQNMGTPKRNVSRTNWTIKLPPYSMLSMANREMLNRPNVAASKANMGDIPCGQIPPSFLLDSSSGSTFPSLFRFRLLNKTKRKLIKKIQKKNNNLINKNQQPWTSRKSENEVDSCGALCESRSPKKERKKQGTPQTVSSSYLVANDVKG